MRIASGNSRNVTIFAGQKDGQAVRDSKQAQKGGAGKKAYFAGDSNMAGTRDLIAQKKDKARQQAMKVVGDTFAADKAMDDDMESRREKVRALKQEKLECQRELDWYSGEQERLKGVYGVAEDSEEQREMVLLLKCKDPNGKATVEERGQAEAIQADGLTEYQSRVLELEDAKKPYQDKIDENDRVIEQENASIEAMRRERLKKNPMVKAQKQADKILEAASQEIIDMVTEDAKEHIDEESEEREETGEKIEEEREAQEELIEKRREDRDEMEELLEDTPMDEMLSLSRMQDDVKQEVQDILNKMKLVAEDIKGAAVDESL